MDRSPTPTEAPDLRGPRYPAKSNRHAKGRRIVFGSAALLLTVLLGWNFLLTGGSGASADPMNSDASRPLSTSPILVSSVSSAVSNSLTPSLSPIPTSTPSPSPSQTPSPSPTPTPTAVPEIRATLTAVGDIIMHMPVIDGGLTNPGEAIPVYDFNMDFQYISSILQASDLAAGNFEGTLNGPPYTGFPSFSSPDEIADALYNAGFRVICTANNHCIDKGYDGLVRTATVLREKGLTVIGTRPDITSPKDTIADLGGIKVGLLNYTFETPGTEQRKTINGIPIPDGAYLLIDSFNPYREAAYETDLKYILSRAEELRRQGAEVICLTLHWGEEYNTHSVAWQQNMAQDLCDAGIDLIIGHHPHVLEEIEVLTSAATGKQTLVYYSLGNFLGNWNYGTLGTAGKAQDGMIARVTFLQTSDGVVIEKGEYIPTYVVRVPKGSGLQHLIVPVRPGLADPAAYQTTTEEMQASYDRINKILGTCIGTAEIPVMEAAN